jgi:hypothetical protein
LKRKVFGIGFHKTATTSLAQALTHLGYRVTGPNAVTDPNIAEVAEQTVYEIANYYDAFQDNPWPLFYRQLDRAFPGSKFILTIRPTEAWLRSIVNHARDISTPMRTWIYGVGNPKGHEAVYVARYERHNREVMEYFRERPHDLLVMDITASDGWEKLCPFLGEQIPPVAFPHANTGGEVSKWRRRERSKLRQAYNKAKTLVTGALHAGNPQQR